MRSQYTASETRRNYVLLVAEGILFTVGLVFFDPNTLLPLLMERMTGAAVLAPVAGGIIIQQVGYTILFSITIIIDAHRVFATV